MQCQEMLPSGIGPPHQCRNTGRYDGYCGLHIRGKRMAKKRTMVDVPLEIPADTYNKLQPLLQRRGVQIQDLINLHLRSLVTLDERSKAYTLQDEMPFGQYKGENVELVIRANPRYAAWLVNTSETFHFDQDAIDLINAILERDKS